MVSLYAFPIWFPYIQTVTILDAMGCPNGSSTRLDQVAATHWMNVLWIEHQDGKVNAGSSRESVGSVGSVGSRFS